MSTERGRPRSFDTDAVLAQATELFWRHGYQGSSLAELTAATGLSKPSLYAAFGDKESLYLQCLERYVQRQVDVQATLLDEEPDARRAVEGFLRAMAGMQSDPKLPGGCFVVTGLAECGNPGTPAAVEAALRKAMLSGGERLRQRLQRGERDGQLPEGTDARRLGALFGAVLNGMAVMAKAGEPRRRLEEAVEAAMMVWPPVRKPASRRR